MAGCTDRGHFPIPVTGILEFDDIERKPDIERRQHPSDSAFVDKSVRKFNLLYGRPPPGPLGGIRYDIPDYGGRLAISLSDAQFGGGYGYHRLV